MASASGCGVDFRKSRLGIVAEHAASMKPHAMTAMTRLMIGSHHWAAQRRLSPKTTTIEARQGLRNLGFLPPHAMAYPP